MAELTAHAGVSHNAVRQHLAKLVDTELVTESTVSTGRRGRPKLVYRPAPSIDSRWGALGPYERLAGLLIEVIRTGDSPVEVGRRAIGRRRLGDGRDDTDPVDALVEQMAREGFEPRVRRRDQRVDLTLEVCPFASVAVADPDTVCRLHSAWPTAWPTGSPAWSSMT